MIFYICWGIVGHMWKCNLSANMTMCFEMLKTSWMLLKIKLKLYYTVHGKKHNLLKKRKVGRLYQSKWKGKGSGVWPSMVTHTRNLCSAFNPSKCTHTQWIYIWSSGQPMLRCPGSSWGIGALLKGLTQSWYWRWREWRLFTPPTDNPCRTWDSRPSGYKSDSLSIIGHDCPVRHKCSFICLSTRFYFFNFAPCFVPLLKNDWYISEKYIKVD